MSLPPSTIVFVTQPWDTIELPFRSGSSIAIVVYNLARHLSDRHRVIIICSRRPGQAAIEEDDAGITIHRLRVHSKPAYQILDRTTSFWNLKPPLFCSRGYYKRFFASAAAQTREIGADIVHITTFFQHLHHFRAAVPRAKLVLHMHGEMLSLVDQKTAAGAGDADLVLGCSQFLVDRIKVRLPAVADRCRTLPNGVDPERFRPRQAGPEGPPLVLYVGRLSPEKGIHVLLDAFRTVRQAIPEVTLELIGAPGLLPHAYHLGLTSDLLERELERFYGGTLVEKFYRQLLHKDTSYLKEIGLDTTSGVCVRGTLDHAHLPTAYQNATVFAFPSVWNEPFGMPIAEAQAVGIPVVASRGGGIPEIVHDGKTGVLVDRSDVDGLAKALIRLLDDPEHRGTLGAAGRAWITSTLSWPQIGSLLEHQYELYTTCGSESQ